MRALVQRVKSASVSVEDEVVGQIGQGLLVFIGITHSDDSPDAKKMAERLWKLRIFSDDDDKMNLAVKAVGGQILIISQFTLYADTSNGNRPSFGEAANPNRAETLISEVGDTLTSLGAQVASGSFGATMSVDLVNDGPATFMLSVGTQ